MKQLMIILIIMQFILGQEIQKGIPYSQTNNSINYNIINLPLVNHDMMLEEDTYRELSTPFRYGYKHQVHFSPENSGNWHETNDGGMLWQITLKSENAFAIGLEFDDFYIPEGGKLFVYSPEYEMIHGAYTHLNNSASQQFSTPLIKGDISIIEYYQPLGSTGKVSLIITEVIHDYRDIMNYYNDEGRDFECGVNVICEEDEVYQGPINSVAFLDMGGFICSGAMVNNVRQDLTPYFLTAWHCVDGDNPSTFRFYFHKEATSCENTWSSLGSYAYSSDLVADSNGINGGDFALLLITDDIEEDWEVFYAGWDASGDYPIISCGIHHPGGTGKKINYDDDTAYGDWWTGGSPSDLTHWKVNWDEGGTEGGSSGSPLFNDHYRIVGNLTGGSGECGEGQDLYGKFSYGWNWEMPSNRRMIDWLDPDFTGTLVIDGTHVVISEMTGDLNSDDTVNILDIIQLANMILSDEFANNADLNGDYTLNILDIIFLVNIILYN